MNEQTDIEIQLEELGAAYRAAAPRGYNQEEEKYGKCPPLIRYAEAACDNSWSWQERLHVSQCPYCQKTIAMVWDQPDCCPSEQILKHYAAGIQTFQRAIQSHLAETDCKRCNKVLQQLETPSWLSIFLPVLSRVAGCEDTDSAERFRLHQEFSHGTLAVTISADLSKRIQLQVRCPHPASDSPKRCRITLRPADGSTPDVIDLELIPAGELGMMAARELGSLEVLSKKLSGCEVTAQWT